MEWVAAGSSASQLPSPSARDCPTTRPCSPTCWATPASGRPPPRCPFSMPLCKLCAGLTSASSYAWCTPLNARGGKYCDPAGPSVRGPDKDVKVWCATLAFPGLRSCGVTPSLRAKAAFQWVPVRPSGTYWCAYESVKLWSRVKKKNPSCRCFFITFPLQMTESEHLSP